MTIECRNPVTWATAPDEELLSLRICDLGLRLEQTPLQRDVEALQRALEKRGVRFRPHAWLSSEFFSPDGVPGLALPFWLAHPRLVRLERAQMGFVEASRRAERLALLRHEAGHALDTAHQLFRGQEWRALFGLRSAPYRRHYTADPTSRDFVRYLPRWYAQSHPAEDFAETFALWLDPPALKSARTSLTGLARKKLAFVEELMGEVRASAPTIRLRERTEHLGTLRETLGRYYARKRRRLASEEVPPFESVLESLFEEDGRASVAAATLRQAQPTIRRRARGRFRGDTYSVDQIVDAMVRRVHQRGLGATRESKAVVLEQLTRATETTLEVIGSGDYELAR